jgi:hypothetical protein
MIDAVIRETEHVPPADQQVPQQPSPLRDCADHRQLRGGDRGVWILRQANQRSVDEHQQQPSAVGPALLDPVTDQRLHGHCPLLLQGGAAAPGRSRWKAMRSLTRALLCVRHEHLGQDTNFPQLRGKSVWRRRSDLGENTRSMLAAWLRERVIALSP